MRRFAVLSTSAVAAGASLLVVSPASAHTPDISASCDGVHVGATAYDANMANRWSVTIGGVTQSGTFGSSFDQTFPVPQDGATTAWSAYVEAEDGSFHGERSGTVGPCGTPVDDCADLPGNQPAGTPCLPPPDVTRADAQSLDGCDVTFGGTSYGAGTLTYDEEYTDTYVFNEQTNGWDLVADTTATIADIVFTPWSVSEQVRNDCVDKPEQPPAEDSSDSASPDVSAGEAVLTTSSTAPASAASSAQVPTAVDAGLSPTTTVSAATSSAGAAGDHETPTLLLMLGGVALLSMAGRRALLRR